MAFISAVLMLFLSVVLMLPISTLTSNNNFTDSKRIISNFVGAAMLTTNVNICDFIVFILILTFAIFGLLSFCHVAVTSFKNIHNTNIKNM
jgi:hypothetical protein